MASYHVSVKTISRSEGRSAVAAAAYRAGVCLVDDEVGLKFDYRKKSGVLSSEIFLPPGADISMLDRNVLWNAATAKEKRKNSTLAREMEVALPAELNFEQRSKLLRTISLEIVEKHKIAVDTNQHLPHRHHSSHDDDYDFGDKDKEHITDNKKQNYHGHIEMSTRRLTADGFGEKAREWDDRKSGTVEYWRERVATLTNEALAEAGFDTRVDHRSLAGQGIERAPIEHLPRAVFEMEQRGKESHIGELIQVRTEAKHAQRFVQIETAALEIINGDISKWTKELESLTLQAAEVQEQVAIIQAESILSLIVESVVSPIFDQIVSEESILPPVVVQVVDEESYISPVLTVDALEKTRMQHVYESNKLHDKIRELTDERVKSKTSDEIESAKINVLKLTKDIESIKLNIDLNVLALDKLNFKFIGLYDMLPDWLTPERVRLKNLLSKDKTAVKTLQARVKKVQSDADAPNNIADIDQRLGQAKQRRQQIIEEVQALDAELVKAQQREINNPVQHSRLVPSRSSELGIP